MDPPRREVEPPVGIEPTTCSLRGGRTTPTTASTSDNSCRTHTFECNSGTVRPEFAPRLIPRSASARAHVILVHEEAGPSARTLHFGRGFKPDGVGVRSGGVPTHLPCPADQDQELP